MKLFKAAQLCGLAGLLAIQAGCGRQAVTQTGWAKAPAFNVAAKRKRERGGTWNVLVHLAAENNLYRFGVEDLNEMEAALPEDGSVNFYVLFDGIQKGDSAIYRIKRDTGLNGTVISEKLNVPEIIPASGEIDSGDVKIVTRFVEWAATNLKADHTALTFWDHGSGLFNGGPNPITKGFGWDDGGSHMQTADLTTLGQAYRTITGKPLDVVGFDACLMAHGEIAYQLDGLADYLVASEELEPGKGWDYVGWLKGLSASDRTPAAVASALVDSYGASYQPGGSQSSGRDSITLSAIDVNAFNKNVVPALNQLVSRATQDMATHKLALQTARSKARSYYNADCADLGSFLTQLQGLTKADDMQAAINQTQTLYAQSVVRETHSANLAGSTGLVLYFPTPKQRLNADYVNPAKIAFANTAWKELLQAYR